VYDVECRLPAALNIIIFQATNGVGLFNVHSFLSSLDGDVLFVLRPGRLKKFVTSEHGK
jgi:hypothetical protein